MEKGGQYTSTATIHETHTAQQRRKGNSGKMSQLARAGLTAAMLLLLAAAAAAAGGAAVAGPASCQDDVVALNEACYQYVQKGAPTVPPSQECCDAVKSVDVPCVCTYLGSPGVRDNISMEKVFYVSQQCGVNIPGNCGGSKRV